MDKYKIQLSTRAYRDLDEIFFYISHELQSSENAQSQTNRLWQSLKILETFPQSHQQRMTGKYASKGYHQLLIDNYIVIYRIDNPQKIVFVITIQYYGRNM